MIKEKIDFIKEAISYYIKRIKIDDEDKENYHKYLKYGIEESYLDNIFKSYNEYLKVIDAKAKDLNSKYHTYFTKYQERDIPFIFDFYLHYYLIKDKKIEEIINYYYKELLEEITDQEFEEVTIDSIISALNSENFSDGYKYLLISFYSNGKLIFNEILEELKPTIKLLEDYFYIIEDDLVKFYNNVVLKEDFVNRVNKELGTSYKLEELKVYIQIINYNSLTIQMRNDITYLWIGYLLFTIIDLKQNKNNIEQKLLNTLKTISDPTRYKILKILNKSPKYNQELANMLNLSSATLNHHINILLNEGIIAFDINQIDKKKIYYKLKDHIIEDIIESLRGEFL